MEARDEGRFWSKVQKRGPDECWEWTAGRSEGYGMFRARGVPLRSHRITWELANGPIPPGLSVLHRCDNRLCCNPGHLFLGTRADNMRECAAKGRQARGSRLPQTKLTGEQIAVIRERYLAGGVKQIELAEEYGVCQQAISRVLRGQNQRAAIEAAGGAVCRELISNADAELIRRLAASQASRRPKCRLSQAALAAVFGCHQTTVSRIIRGKR